MSPLILPEIVVGVYMHRPDIISHDIQIYKPIEILFNAESMSLLTPFADIIQHCIAHEMVHVVEGHVLKKTSVELVFLPLQSIKDKKNQLIEQIELMKNKTDNMKLLYDKMQFKNNESLCKEYNLLYEEYCLLYDKIKLLENEFDISLKKDLSRREKYYKLLNEYSSSSVKKKYIASQEKTADTLSSCTDIETAENARGFLKMNIGYIDNYNDIKVIHANWQLTHLIEKKKHLYQNFEKKRHELKNSLRKYWYTVSNF